MNHPTATPTAAGDAAVPSEGRGPVTGTAPVTTLGPPADDVHLSRHAGALREFARGRARAIAAAALAALLVLAPAAPGTAAAQTPVRSATAGTERLEAEIARLAESEDGTVGVAAIHLETGREVYLNGDAAFPMASTYKVPIAVQLFSRVDRGEIRMDSLIAVESGDLHPGSGTLTDLFDDPGVRLSLRNLTELMLLISDNSATDMVLEAAGGPAAVTRRMRALGIDGIRVDRPTVGLIADYLGVYERPSADALSPERFGDLLEQVPDSVREEAAEAFDRDPRDTATPAAMGELLAMIWHAEGLSEESSELLLDIMRRCETGDARLKGMLPPETTVYHKTGTIGGTTNDIGIIELPGDAGHVVTVVFVKESEREVSERERVIAQIARAVHDYFVFATAGAAS